MSYQSWTWAVILLNSLVNSSIDLTYIKQNIGNFLTININTYTNSFNAPPKTEYLKF